MSERTVFYVGGARGAAGPWARTPAPSDSPVRAAYDRYLDRQCQAFLQLIPRDGIRPLYARARTWAAERGLHESKDPMAGLLAFCRAHLPLPSFRVWQADLAANPGAHAEDAFRLPRSEEDRAPNRIAVRWIEHGGARWRVGLNVFHDDGAWRGYIDFLEEAPTGRPRAYRTTSVFCEPQLATVEEVFAEFRDDALAGFLRSALP
ncbi:MAG: hypothetical protein R3E10_14465 [Gemmatimonadota bacterium]